MEIKDLLHANGILINIQGTHKIEILTQMVRYMASIYNLPDVDFVTHKILERETVMSTGIGCGIAIPHARLDTIDGIYLIAARSVTGVNFDAIDKQPVHLLFMLISPTVSVKEQTRVLSALSRIMSNAQTRKELFSATDPERFLDLLMEKQPS